jgi:glutamate-1-semialdehyde 2,1-aminomutase
MLEQGAYLAPSSYEAGFISNAHSEEDIEKTIELANQAFEKI